MLTRYLTSHKKLTYLPLQCFSRLNPVLVERANAFIEHPTSDNLIKYSLQIQKAPRKEIF